MGKTRSCHTAKVCEKVVESHGISEGQNSANLVFGIAKNRMDKIRYCRNEERS